jgi:hypothetical protein
VPGIAGQGIAHGLDDMGQRVEADDIAGAIGGALGRPIFGPVRPSTVSAPRPKALA